MLNIRCTKVSISIKRTGDRKSMRSSLGTVSSFKTSNIVQTFIIAERKSTPDFLMR